MFLHIYFHILDCDPDPHPWFKLGKFYCCRIIDARYAYEYQGGHINGAENWQHGEDEQFLSAFLPTAPLPAPPSPFLPNNTTKRDILIFHCEFSSHRHSWAQLVNNLGLFWEFCFR